MRGYVLAAFLCLLEPAHAAGPTREARWREDIRYAMAQLELRHANLYHSVSRGDLVRAARSLEARAASYDDSRMVIELSRLLAMVKDGHSGYFIPWDRRNGFRTYPIELWMVPEGPLVIATPPELSHLRGTVITRFGKSPARTVVEAIRPLLSLDNPFGEDGLLPAYIVVPEVLQALGLIDDMERLAVEARAASGESVSGVLRPVPAASRPPLELLPAASRPLWLSDREDPYWLRWLAAEKTLFIQYNDASREKEGEPIAAFCERVRMLVQSEPLARLVLDLRWNDGGSLTRTRPLLHTLIQMRNQLPEGRLFVLIGRMTFSAAGLFAVELEQHFSALFVGEPTASRPNGYGELRRFRLPHSGLEVRYSAWRYQTSSPGDTRPALMPDLSAVLTAADFRSGRDPAMEAIRAYRPRTALRDALRQILRERGAPGALEEYRRLEKERYNNYVFGEEELDALARELVDSDRVEPALVVLAFNAEKYPHSARAHASLADTLARSGRCSEARRSAETAFALDRSYLTPEERLERAEPCRAEKALLR